MGDRVTPKRERVGLDLQQGQLERLLTVWPNVDEPTAFKFIKETLKTTMTRVVFQQARSALGLHKPEYQEHTLRKKCFVELTVLQLIEHHGVGGLGERELNRRISKALLEQFQEKTHAHLIKTWIAEMLGRLQPVAHNPALLMDLMNRIRQELASLRIVTKDHNQIELI